MTPEQLVLFLLVGFTSAVVLLAVLLMALLGRATLDVRRRRARPRLSLTDEGHDWQVLRDDPELAGTLRRCRRCGLQSVSFSLGDIGPGESRHVSVSLDDLGGGRL